MNGLSIVECKVYGVEKLVEVGKESNDPLTRYLAEWCEVLTEQEEAFCRALSELDELKLVIRSLTKRHTDNVKEVAKARLIKDRREIAENAEDESNETIGYAIEKLNSVYNIIENYLIEKQQ